MLIGKASNATKKYSTLLTLHVLKKILKNIFTKIRSSSVQKPDAVMAWNCPGILS